MLASFRVREATGVSLGSAGGPPFPARSQRRLSMHPRFVGIGAATAGRIPPPPGSERYIHVDVDARGFDLFRQWKLPTPVGIHWDVEHALIVRRDLDTLLVQCTDSLSSELAYEKPQLEDHVLPSAQTPRFWIRTSCARVVQCQQHYGEAHVRNPLELLNDRSPGTRLFVEDYCSEP